MLTRAASLRPTMSRDLLTIGKAYVSVEARPTTELVYSLPKFYATVKKWHPRLNRRSFRAVGESCVTNLIPDPKPDRTHPRPLSRSHYWLLAVTGYPVKAPTTSGLCTLQAVGRGVAMAGEKNNAM